MRPIPAQRIGHAHGLLAALESRGKLRLEEFITEFSEAELFPPGLENPAGHTRQFLSYAIAAGLVKEERGAVELTELGRRYVKSGDPEHVFGVSRGQAEWLRRQLREKHLTESIFNGAAIALSLLDSLPEGDWVAAADIGRSVAHLGRTAWDDEQTFQAQGERLTRLLEDMELIGPERTLTDVGRQTIEDLQLPPHAGLKDLAAQLNPEGADGAARAAAQEREALGLGVAADAESAVAAADPPPDASIEAPEDEPSWADSTAGPDEPTRIYARPAGGAAEGRAGSSVAEDAAPALTPAPPAAPDVEAPPPGLQSGIRPRPTIAALRPQDLAIAPDRPSGPFLDPAEVRAAAERRGLVIDPGVYAAAIAALACGRHLVLTGGAGSGKTALAQAIGEAAVSQGRCRSVLFTSAGGGLRSSHTLGRRSRDGGEFQPGLIPRAIEAEQWLVIDELDRSPLDRALGAASPLLGGQGIEMPGGGVLSPPPGWRMIATMVDIEQVGRTTQALRRRFVFVEVPVLERADLETLVGVWAGDDEVAAAVGRRLVAVNDVVPLGPGLYRDAVAYVKERRSLADASPDDLLLEALAGFVLPQLEGEGDEVAGRAVRAAGFDS